MNVTPPDTESDRECALSFLQSIDILKAFSRDQLDALLDEMTCLRLAPGETLFRQGDPGESIFIVERGTLETSIARDDGASMTVSTITAGQTIGEMQILFDGFRTATVRAVTPVVLSKFSTEGFRRSAASSTGTMEKITQVIRRRLSRDQLTSILPAYFGSLDEAAMSTIEAMIRWVDVPKGHSLFLQNEASDSFYIVISGILHAFSGDARDPKRHFLREMSRGECTGEMGLLSGDKRSASVFAARDSRLACFSSRAFDDILAKYPEINRRFTAVLIKRLQHPSHGRQADRHVKNIAIVPAGAPFPLEDFVEMLSRKLSRYGSALHLSSEAVDRSIGTVGISQVTADDPRSLKLSAWLETQETRHEFILFEASIRACPWTRRSISHADQVILVGRADQDPGLGSIETAFLDQASSVTEVPPLLVLLHGKTGFVPARTKEWLVPRSVKRHHHVCPENDQDMERLARVITGRAVGLTLGGGGARGLAHIGVVRALHEAGIPIDMVGGTSMGAIISAQYAMGMDHEAILAAHRDFAKNSYRLKDYTLPVYSILSGKRLNHVLKDAFGDKCIEDLPVNFFCVSSSLSEARPIIHQQGVLWKAVRASGSLPGIFQPWIHGAELLVDGGLMNNLPGDIMKQQIDGFVIVADASPLENLKITQRKMPSPWRAVWEKVSPFPTPRSFPSVLDILVRSTSLSSYHAGAQIKAAADLCFEPPVERFGLLEFEAVGKIVETGYRYASEKIASLENDRILADLRA